MSQVVTGEAVPLELQVARLPSRLLAGLLDLAIQGVGLTASLAALSASLFPGSDPVVVGVLVLVALVSWLVGYPVLCEARWGRTVGKLALGLRVVRTDGGPIGVRQAFARGLAGAVLEKPGITYGALAAITMLINRDSRRVGDLIGGTMVIQARVAGTRYPPLVAMPPALAGWAAALDLSRLPPELALQCRTFLGRARTLRADAREALGGQLVAAVAAVTTPPPPPGVPGWAYLSAVLAERRGRDADRLANQAGTAARLAGRGMTAGWPTGYEGANSNAAVGLGVVTGQPGRTPSSLAGLSVTRLVAAWDRPPWEASGLASGLRAGALPPPPSAPPAGVETVAPAGLALPA